MVVLYMQFVCTECGQLIAVMDISQEKPAQTIESAIHCFNKEALLSLIMTVVDEHENRNAQRLLAMREMEGHFTLHLWSQLHIHTCRVDHMLDMWQHYQLHYCLMSSFHMYCEIVTPQNWWCWKQNKFALTEFYTLWIVRICTCISQIVAVHIRWTVDVFHAKP